MARAVVMGSVQWNEPSGRVWNAGGLAVVEKVLVIEGEGDGVEDEYETAIKSLDMRFVKCKNVTLERHKFYRRVQAEGESASNYVGALRLLAVSCDYKEFEEEMIRDQLVEKTNNKKVQEALLSTANLTLQKALEIANRIESTVSFMEQMSISEDKNPRPDVLAVKSFYKKGNKKNSNSLQATFSKTEKKFSNKSLECYRAARLGTRGRLGWEREGGWAESERVAGLRARGRLGWEREGGWAGSERAAGLGARGRLGWEREGGWAGSERAAGLGARGRLGWEREGGWAGSESAAGLEARRARARLGWEQERSWARSKRPTGSKSAV
ncbi:hypothetical protein NDU88_004631 [Pleurodeles waltl]|uniref:Retrotransposon gag domain-containing protein n=1 Tax=Pleurodeles waltl TaxID=8319 RepID=A0AAV7W5I9_PLEWA|nr:hypothetical protein NDU88_004631 [Pleurodeles waltl]